MFRIYISDVVLQGIISREEQSVPAHRSCLYKLLKQQPVQVLTASDTDTYKSHPEEVLGITPDCPIYNKLHCRFIPQALFTESSLNGTSTPPLKAIKQTLATLRDFSKSLPKLTDHTTYLYAVNGKRMEKCMGVRNRLIK